MVDTDEMQNTRIDAMDERLRAVENCVLELKQMAKWLKYGVVVIAASLGVDLKEMI